MTSGAEWVAALGTAGATLLAGGALAIQQWDRRRLVPGKVNGWTRIETGHVTHVVLFNGSSDPVFDIIARVVFNGRVIAVVSPDSLPPGERDDVELGEQAEVIWGCVADLNTTAEGPKVALTFRDSLGRVWRESVRGRLTRVRSEFVWADEHLRALAELPSLRGTGADGVEAAISETHPSPPWVFR